jgi:hypothetical protein
VTVRAQLFLEGVSSALPNVYNAQCCSDHLRDSPFLADIDQIVTCFDKTTKLRFLDSDEPQYIKFGGTRDNDQSCNIRFGQLKLLGSDVAKFFEPSVECIVSAVLDQCKVARKRIFVRLSLLFCWMSLTLNFNSSMLCSLVDSLLATGYSTKFGTDCSPTI